MAQRSYADHGYAWVILGASYISIYIYIIIYILVIPRILTICVLCRSLGHLHFKKVLSLRQYETFLK